MILKNCAIGENQMGGGGGAVLSNRVVRRAVQLLKDDNLLACCDGPVNHKRAAHAWGLASRSKKQLFFSGCTPVHGHPNVLNSTRVEMMGIIACITFIDWISERKDIKDNHIMIYTDSEAAITCATMKGLSSTKYALHMDIDVILQLQQCIQPSPNTFALSHVEGHQDKHKILRI